MKALTKADLFNTAWPKPVRVEIPDLAGDIYVRILTAGEKDAYEMSGYQETKDAKTEVNIRGRLVAMCACDEKGVRHFVNDDERELSRRPGTWMDVIYDAAMEANLMTVASKEAVRKNSSTPPASSLPAS